MNNKKTISNKRVCTVIAFILCLTMLAPNLGCSHNSSGIEKTAEMYEFVVSNGEFPTMESMTDDELSDILGIDMTKINDHYMAVSSDASLADEVAIFITADEEYAVQLEKQLTARLTKLAKAAKDYSSRQYEVIKTARVNRVNNFVFYIVNAESVRLSSLLKQRAGV